MIHKITVRIYYEDTDFSGIVYHANYLKFFERGRTEALRDLGVNHGDLLAAEDPAIFAVREMTTRFVRPARIDDLLTITTENTAARGARMIFAQRALRGTETIATADVEVACLTPDGRPRRLPARFRRD